jgi:hypothetical protein
MTDDQIELRRTAIHESAHAVIGARLGLKIKTVTVIPSGDRLGQCDMTVRNCREDWRAAAIADLAAIHAEARYRGYPAIPAYEEGDLIDRYLADQNLRNYCKGRDLDFEKVKREAGWEMEKLVEENWYHITALAEHLVQFGEVSGYWLPPRR